MKIAYYEKYGGPEVIEIREDTKPTPKENEILIQVMASTVNRTDCAILTGKPYIMRLFVGLWGPKRKTTGTDFSGLVVAVGSKVTQYKVGDRIYGFEDTGLATHGQYVCLNQKKPMTHIPDNIGYEDAAACLEGMHYAINTFNRLEIKAGQKVLINGGTGAIGSALVQLCHHYGMDVTAVCRKQHFELVSSLGANNLINYLEEDFTQIPGKYDYVFDAVGKSTFGKCKGIMKENSIYISSELGPWCQNILFPLTTKFSKKKVRFHIPIDIQGSLKLISSLLAKGELKAVIDKVLPLEELDKAFTYVQSGQKVGNVVIKMF